MTDARSAKEVVEAIIRNLDWNRIIHSKRSDDAAVGTEEWAMESALERSLASTIALIRTEAAAILASEK